MNKLIAWFKQLFSKNKESTKSTFDFELTEIEQAGFRSTWELVFFIDGKAVETQHYRRKPTKKYIRRTLQRIEKMHNR